MRGRGGDRASRASDERILTCLDLRDHEGMTMAEIAGQVGMTRSAVIGVVNRVDKASDLPCHCRETANRDGGMPRGWWR